MERFAKRGDKLASLEMFLEFSVWRMYWKLARLEARRSVREQF